MKKHHGLLKQSIRFLEYLGRILYLAREEVKTPVRIQLIKRFWLWQHGFLAKAFVLYNLDKSNIQDYVSDYCRYVKTPLINREYAFLLNNKLAFSKILQKYTEDYLPEDYCLISDGVVTGLTGEEVLRNCDDVLALCKKVTRVIIKPTSKGGGENVYLLKAGQEKFWLNTREISSSAAQQFLMGLEDSLVCEYVQQHSYAAAIFPDAVNTIRLITMWDMEQNRPFIASGEHRFGTRRSSPVDNVEQGGLFCAIHLETGQIGKAGAYVYDPDFRIQWHQQHPDTEAPIAGSMIPHWTMLSTKILDIAGRLPFIPYIGWDLVVTHDGFKVIEGNNFPSLEGQIHGPLLVDPRVRKFYAHYHII
jgi:hypothetical protein